VNQMSSKMLMLTGLCLALSPAYATNLFPGGNGTVTPIPGYSYGSPTFPAVGSSPNAPSPPGMGTNFLQESGAWVLLTNPNIQAHVTFDEAVYVDPQTGDLDFFYQIQNTGTALPSQYAGTDAVASPVVINNFDQSSSVQVTAVDEITSGTPYQQFDLMKAPTAGSSISSVTYTNVPIGGGGNYENLSFSFNAPIGPGQNSAILVIKTNATSYDQEAGANLNWQKKTPLGGVGTDAGTGASGTAFFEGAIDPVLAPEPGFYGVLSLGIAGLLLLIHRRSGKAKAAQVANDQAA
jgi:hypothetical protein